MTRTEYQREAFDSTSGQRDSRAGVAQYATHTPSYLPPPSTYPTAPTAPTAGPSHRTAFIGMTGLALLLAAMAGIAFVRYQDTAVPTTTAAAVTVPHAAQAALAADGVYVAQQVPHAAAAALAADSIHADQKARTALPTLTVPHAATVALRDEG